ncbi:MAG: glycine--tRNA ligase subunit beta [Hydrotalea sp.]|nr:glycine--tRNA ligase subunit beta [Hydrotalea sp.]
MDIVIELMFEELPASEQRRLQTYFEKNWLANSQATKKILIGPRRVALLAFGISPNDLQTTELKKGPRTSAPKEVIGKFLAANGLQEKNLTIDGDYYFYEKTSDIKNWLSTTLEDKNLFSKTMVWQATMENNQKGQSGQSSGQWRAIRPLRQIIIQVDDKPMVGEISWSGKAMTLSQEFIGHRFLDSKPFSLDQAKNYVEAMEKHYVKFSQSNRAIGGADAELSFPCVEEKNLQILEQAFLYNEVLPLVEYPFSMLGEIDDEFMALPKEIIISTIKTHQKFIPLYEKNSLKFSPYFLIIANNGGDATKEKEILAGYQRVLRARLADAKYFLQEDLKHDLYYFREKLKNRLFFQGLGTLYDKTERVKEIALKYKKYFTTSHIEEDGLSDDEIKTAAELCKADLTTQVVNEMPELQGRIGSYYATKMGLSENIAKAIKEHDEPMLVANAPPYLSALIGFSDLLDTLIEFFRIGKIPTGSSDPFALRRAASYLVQTLIQGDISMAIKDLQLSDSLNNFLKERLLYYLEITEASKYILSILEKKALSIPPMQLYKLCESMQSINLSTITALTKRAMNIVDAQYTAIDEKKLAEPAEKNFFAALQRLDGDLQSALKADDMLAALRHIAAVEQPLNDFFDKVLVNDKDEAKKQNRHALINRFLSLSHQVADFSLE